MSSTLRRVRAVGNLAIALPVAVAVEVGLRVVGLPTLARFAAVELDVTGVADGPAVPTWRLGPRDDARYRAAQRVLRWWPFGRNGQCLRMALTAGHLLRHRRPRLRLGVVRTQAGLSTGTTAHAWLVVDDMIFDPAAAECVPLGRLSP